MKSQKPSREYIEKPKDVVIGARVWHLADVVAGVDDASFGTDDFTVEKLGIPCRTTDLITVSPA